MSACTILTILKCASVLFLLDQVLGKKIAYLMSGGF